MCVVRGWAMRSLECQAGGSGFFLRAGRWPGQVWLGAD